MSCRAAPRPGAARPSVFGAVSASDVWVLIPAYNEATTIGAVVGGVAGLGCPIVVVDDGSRDGTAQALDPAPVHLLRHPINLGQGAALKTAFRYALGRGARYLVTFDADGQHRPEDIPRLVDPLAQGRADVALGTRFGREASAPNMPAGRRLALKLAVALTDRTLGLPLTDAHNGLRALTASAAAALRLTQPRMAHASQILAEIKRLRLRWVEVPVSVRYTPYSLAKGQGTSQALNIVWELLLEVLRR